MTNAKTAELVEYLRTFFDKHCLLAADRLEAQAKEIVELREALRNNPCPRPAWGHPDDETVGACLDSGACGCECGAAQEKSNGE